MKRPATNTAHFWIEKLNLIRHEEGGYFREIYRSAESIPGEYLPGHFRGARPLGTSIYFLLEGMQISVLHRLKADEIWHFYTGNSLTIFAINPQGVLSQIFLGPDIENGEVFQAVVPAGYWFGAKLNRKNTFALVGCTMAPGFDYADFEIGERGELLKQFPQHRRIIEMLTR